MSVYFLDFKYHQIHPQRMLPIKVTSSTVVFRWLIPLFKEKWSLQQTYTMYIHSHKFTPTETVLAALAPPHLPKCSIFCLKFIHHVFRVDQLSFLVCHSVGEALNLTVTSVKFHCHLYMCVCAIMKELESCSIKCYWSLIRHKLYLAFKQKLKHSTEWPACLHSLTILILWSLSFNSSLSLCIISCGSPSLTDYM